MSMSLLRSVLSVGLSLALWGAPGIAMALSAGATSINGHSSVGNFYHTVNPFDAGEIITVTVDNPVGATSAAASLMSGAGNVSQISNSFPAVLTLTVPSTGVFTFIASTAGGNARISIAVAEPNPASAADNADAVSNTIASASRGQTSVITGNIMSRTATASFGAPPQEGRGRDLASSFNKGSLYQRDEQHEAREMSIKELAQFATFNTSQSVAAAADGGVSGIEQRRGILTSDPFTIWGHASFTSADNDFNKGGDDRRYNGNVWGYSLGADYRFHEKVIAGLSVGYTDTDITTSYNSGKYEEQSWNFSPYVMYEPVDGALISFIAGYSFGDVDRKRNSTVTGNTDSDMWYTALEGEYRMQPADSIPLELTARLGYLLSEKTLDAFTESDGTRVGESTADTSQIKPGVEVAYSFNAQGMTLQPFVKADYIHDFVDEINDDSNALNLGGGLRVLSGETGLSGVIEGERQFCRDDYSEYTIKGLLAYNFALNGDDGNQLGLLAPYVKSNLSVDGGQVFGAGLKYTSADGVMSCELDATHAMSSEDAGNTGARMMLELAY